MANPFSTFSDGTTDYEVKDATSRSSITSHVAESIASANGAHGFRYYNDTFYYKSGSSWVSVPSGAGAKVLTQSEYDALSTTEKNADVIYIISDS